MCMIWSFHRLIPFDKVRFTTFILTVISFVIKFYYGRKEKKTGRFTRQSTPGLSCSGGGSCQVEEGNEGNGDTERPRRDFPIHRLSTTRVDLN